MKFLILTIALVSFNNFYSQLDTTFWFVAPEVAQNHGDRPIVFRFATLNTPATIEINQPANPSFPIQTLNLNANSAETINLTQWIDIIENKPPNTVLNYGFKIKSSTPITAYYEVTPTCNCNPDIFALKGENALGTAFLTPFQNFLNNASYARSGFNIVATEDNTVITIVPSQNIVGHSAGSPFTISLNRGQTFLAEATSTSSALHLGGSSVVSNKKIAITLHDDSAMGTPYGGCADLQGDQLIPISLLGSEYIAIKGYLNGPDKVYILGTSNGTSLSIDGVNVGVVNLGQTYVHTLSSPTAYIVASDSIYVLQQSGFGCEVGEAILPPIVCTGSNIVPFTRSTNEFFAVNILVPTGGEGNFLYNGASGVINSNSFNFVPGTGNLWKYAQIDMSSFVPIQQGSRIENNSFKFHAGIIHGGSSSGCRFGYFSDFASSRYQIQSNNQSYCVGETINLSTKPLLGATYNWNGPNNFSFAGSSLTIPNAQIANSGQYIVSGQMPDVCVLIPDTVTINVYPIPQKPTILNDGPWCTNSIGKVWHDVNAPFIYQWNQQPNNSYIQNDTLFIDNSNFSGLINLSLTSSFMGCTSETSVKTIEVSANPIIEIVSPTDICGNNILLDSKILNFQTDPIDSIYWYKLNPLELISQNQNTFNFSSSKTPYFKETFYLKVKSLNGCIEQDSIDINFHPLPIPVISFTDMCNGKEILFTLNNNFQGVTAANETYTSVINFGDGQNQINPNQTTAHIYPSIQQYIASFTINSSNNCKDSSEIILKLQDIPKLEPSISVECGQKASFLSNLSLGNFEMIKFNWEIQGLSSSNQPYFSYTFENSGNYSSQITITGSNQCVFTFPFEFSIQPSIDLSNLNIPNVITPNADEINDFLELNPLFENCNKYELSIINRWGNLVFSTNSSLNPFKGDNFDGSNLLSGTYFYKITTEDSEKSGFISIIR